MATGGDAESLVPEALRVLSLTDLINLIRATTSNKNDSISSSEWLATIPIFDGSSEQCIEAWFERVETVRDAYEVPKKKMAVLITSKLSGRARRLYDSKAEYATYSYDELKRVLTAFFKNGEDRMTRMKRFESRRWRKQEPFSAYFQEKMALGNRLGFMESDLLAYMIDGFDNPPLQAQAKMSQFKDLATLLGVMNELTAEERGCNMMPSTRVQPTVFPRVETQGTYPTVRCFNCGGVGHMASRCIKPKNDGVACYDCGSKEHQQRFCKNVRSTAQVAPDSTTFRVNEILAIDGEITTDGANISISDENDYEVEDLESEKPEEPETAFEMHDYGVIATAEDLVEKEYLESEKPEEPETAFEMHDYGVIATAEDLVEKEYLESEKPEETDTAFEMHGYGAIATAEDLETEKREEPETAFEMHGYGVVATVGDLVREEYLETEKRVVRDSYPSPRIDDCLDSPKSKRYFTKLDLENAFFHVVVAETSRKYTSLGCAQGEYEYNRMPFGYCNSPNVSMRYVSDIFRCFVMNCEVIVYMNDLLMATETIEENIEVLRRVLEMIRRNKLELKLNKYLDYCCIRSHQSGTPVRSGLAEL
ncbi:uncharacterized protein LOC113389816 [Ctenocephalides felis]|uniref:uncharacterized protein LOC113389816 n=1 Tax=Ctenocephalides felis TaxID=7515 RepID=UPI000E6E4E6D|nr:uncharacterized protein LOC113389816 [Ctenocephalides felis]